MKEDKEVIISELRSKLAQYKENETKIKGILLQIGSLSSGVVRGNLERRLDLSKFPKTWQTIGNNVNKMVESIQLNIQELKNRDKALSSTISSFGSVLSAASAGDLTTKIDLSKISEEYRSIGEDINSMIVSFNQIVDTIQNASVEVSDKAQKMATVSEETTLAMEEIAESTKLIAVAAEKQSTAAMDQATAAMAQATATEETQSALEEQTKSSEELSTIGQELLSLSDNLSATLKSLKIKPAKQKG